MKNMLTAILSILLWTNVYSQKSQTLSGAYLSKNSDTNELLLIMDGYCSFISYKENEYVNTWGGPISTENNKIEVQIEYNDKDKEKVGKKLSIPFQIQGANLKAQGLIWIKQPTTKQNLDGLWRITGRDQAGTVTNIPKGDRKTIKLLAGGYFQWIAINPAEKGFYGTGGGNYEFAKSTYTEKIVFFSRDNTRVGAALQFKGELKDDQWHHSGKSSKGDPIYEIWSRE